MGIKHFFTTCFVFMVPYITSSQWQEHMVSNTASVPTLVVAKDMDNDGYVDIIATQRGQNAVFWYKNDGAGNFSPPLLIAQNLANLRGLAVGDLTGNGFIDVLVSTQTSTAEPPNLRWIEHLDGDGTFGVPQIIPENPTTISEGIVLGDIDGDGLLDIIVSASAASDRSIAWYRNLGNGTFSSPNVIITNFSNATGIAVGDIDGDGHLDVVSGTSNTGVMSWFKNLDGEGNFGPPIPIGSSGSPGFNVLRLHLVDIDGDGDLDVVGSSGLTQAFAWWENLDGEGTFGTERFIDLERPITGIYPADIDNDGDIDLFALSPGSPPGTIGFMYWYENLDGLGNFGDANFISDNVRLSISIVAADINNDGNIDPITAKQDDQTILWFENPLLSINDNERNDFVLYPNPVNDRLFIKTSRVPLEYLIYNSKGQKIMEGMWQSSQTYIDVSHLSSGIYFGELNYPNSKEKFKFLKQ